MALSARRPARMARRGPRRGPARPRAEAGPTSTGAKQVWETLLAGGKIMGDDLSVLSPSEVAELVFDVQDLNLDGFLQRNEVERFADLFGGQEHVSARMREERWGRMLRALDANADGLISKDEFVFDWLSHYASKVDENGKFASNTFRNFLADSIMVLMEARIMATEGGHHTHD